MAEEAGCSEGSEVRLMARKLGEGIISINADVSDAMAVFNGLEVNKKAIQKKLLTAVGTGGKQAIKRNYRSVLRKRSGTLYKSIRSYVKRNASAVVFTNSADSGKNTGKGGKSGRYGFMLASGYDVEAKNKLLTFNIDGKWYRMHQVHVEAKDFTQKPIENYVESMDCNNRMETALQKQVDYWDKKLGGKA